MTAPAFPSEADPDPRPDPPQGFDPAQLHEPDQVLALILDYVAAHGLHGVADFIGEHDLGTIFADLVGDHGEEPDDDPTGEEAWADAWWETREEHLGKFLRVALRAFRVPQPPPAVLASAAERLSIALFGQVLATPTPAPGSQQPAVSASRLDAQRLVDFVADTIDGSDHDDLAPFGLDDREFPSPDEWVGVISGLVRSGPGGEVSPQRLIEHIDACPLLTGPPTGEQRRRMLTELFELLLPAWECAGVIERDKQEVARLTALGAWILPEAARHTWGP